jgi:hypothetical protein
MEDRKIEFITIPIKMDNGDGNINATIHLKRVLFSNEDEKKYITVIWEDEFGDEVEHCYFDDLSKENQNKVMGSIEFYDRKYVRDNSDAP